MAIIRRSIEELKDIKISANKTAYELDEQPDFNGTQEELEMMQAFERAYIDGYPEISDEEWDILKNRYNYKESLTAGAPSGRTWVRMQAPLPSIEKVTDQESLLEFCKRFPGREFSVEPKLDGLTANLVYDLKGDKYVFQCITSRGNGRYGMQLWENALKGIVLGGVPETIEKSAIEKSFNCAPARIEIRGEAVINKELWCKERNISDEDSAKMVWRSIVSGIFNRKVPANIDGICMINYGSMAIPLVCGSNGVFNIEDRAIARQIASLTDDTHRFGRTSKVSLHYNGSEPVEIHIVHADGVEYSCKAYNEYVDIVAYSIGINGVNMPIAEKEISNQLIYIDQCKLLGNYPSPIFKITNKPEYIINTVASFYGCDKNWKRIPELPRLRNKHIYAMDGVVIKVLDTNIEDQGMTIRNNKSNKNKVVMPNAPSDAIAVKLLSETVKVKLAKIEFSGTTLGNTTCQGILETPCVTESGAVVSNINLHNPEWLKANAWIHEGGEYLMCMSMDIIPVLLPPEK